MLRLSKLTDYGTVAMAYIARDADRTHAAAELAAAIGVAVPTASKILKMLARGNLLRSMRGAKGGYMLSRPAGEISIAEVIDAMEGPIGVTECRMQRHRRPVCAGRVVLDPLELATDQPCDP